MFCFDVQYDRLLTWNASNLETPMHLASVSGSTTSTTQISGIQQDFEENNHRETVSGGSCRVREGRQDGGNGGAVEGSPEHQQVVVSAGRCHLGAFHQRKVRPLPEQQAHAGKYLSGMSITVNDCRWYQRWPCLLHTCLCLSVSTKLERFSSSVTRKSIFCTHEGSGSGHAKSLFAPERVAPAT